jgi:predicted DNA-binding ribbon-helix-helix protein
VLKSRQIVINGHPTSFKLEPEYWPWLKEIAAEIGTTIKALIEAISATRSYKRDLICFCGFTSNHQGNGVGTRQGI